MKTVKEFCEKTHLPAGLVRAVIRQSGGWDSFRESAPDVANHGAAGGFSGFIYYADTVPFAKRNKANILEYAESMASEIGADGGALGLIAGFNCLSDITALDVASALYKRNDENAQRVFNALAWFAVEGVSRSYVDLMESAQ